MLTISCKTWFKSVLPKKKFSFNGLKKIRHHFMDVVVTFLNYDPDEFVFSPDQTNQQFLEKNRSRLGVNTKEDAKNYYKQFIIQRSMKLEITKFLSLTHPCINK